MTATAPPRGWQNLGQLTLRATATAHPLELAWLCPCGTRVPRGGMAWQLTNPTRWRCGDCVEVST